MVYRYLYQDSGNNNLEGEIKAKNRADAYTKLRKNGIRPYRLIGNDPVNWRPVVFYVLQSIFIVVLIAAGVILWLRVDAGRVENNMSDSEKAEYIQRAKRIIEEAPGYFQYHVWKGVNADLIERGLEPLPLPEGVDGRK